MSKTPAVKCDQISKIKPWALKSLCVTPFNVDFVVRIACGNPTGITEIPPTAPKWTFTLKKQNFAPNTLQVGMSKCRMRDGETADSLQDDQSLATKHHKEHSFHALHAKHMSNHRLPESMALSTAWSHARDRPNQYKDILSCEP